eukprot:2861204-Rhodomonas_salina.1
MGFEAVIAAALCTGVESDASPRPSEILSMAVAVSCCLLGVSLSTGVAFVALHSKEVPWERELLQLLSDSESDSSRDF